MKMEPVVVDRTLAPRRQTVSQRFRRRSTDGVAGTDDDALPVRKTGWTGGSSDEDQ
jgi:hypothetical protein